LTANSKLFILQQSLLRCQTPLVPDGITILRFVLYENLSDNRQPTGLLATDSAGRRHLG